MLDPRITEHRNPRSADIDLASPLEIVEIINAEDRTVADAVATQKREVAAAIAIAEDCFRRGGRLVYAGAGTSGRLGVLDASECPPTFGVDFDMVVGLIAGGYDALLRAQEGVPVPVLAASLFDRFSSRGEAEFGNRLLSAMRRAFGGHLEKTPVE